MKKVLKLPVKFQKTILAAIAAIFLLDLAHKIILFFTYSPSISVTEYLQYPFITLDFVIPTLVFLLFLFISRRTNKSKCTTNLVEASIWTSFYVITLFFFNALVSLLFPLAQNMYSLSGSVAETPFYIWLTVLASILITLAFAYHRYQPAADKNEDFPKAFKALFVFLVLTTIISVCIGVIINFDVQDTNTSLALVTIIALLISGYLILDKRADYLSKLFIVSFLIFIFTMLLGLFESCFVFITNSVDYNIIQLVGMIMFSAWYLLAVFHAKPAS